VRGSILVAWVLLGAACAVESDASRQLTGVVVEVNSPQLGRVRSFEITSEGEVYEIFIDPDVSYSFPPPHLHSHLASAEPLRVGIERRSGRWYATSMEDA
jgi:hypothetical protein